MTVTIQTGENIMAFLLIFFILTIIIINTSTIFVKERKIAIIERFGKFKKLCLPGISFKLPFIDTVAGELSLQVQQHDVTLETKTQDNVFVDIHCSIQYKVLSKQAFEAFYALENPEEQLESYVFDAIRGLVPKRSLDLLFEEKDEIAKEVKKSLDHVMHDYGIEILQTLITHIDPDHGVKQAMNDINAAERNRIAATHKAEAEKLITITAAEAQKQSKILQGEGIAGQRTAIIHGLKQSFEAFKSGLSHDENAISEEAIMQFLLQIQYYDTLKDIGSHSKSNAIYLGHQAPKSGESISKKEKIIQDNLTALMETVIASNNQQKN